MKRSGRFFVGGRRIYGELTRSGPATEIYLQDEEAFPVEREERPTIQGVLNDLTKVTLVECVPITGFGSSVRGEERYYFARLFPHFVLEGREHLDTEKSNVAAIHFQLTDCIPLFYDFDAFGHVSSPDRELVREVIKANKLNRDVRIGSNPHLLYFTGQHDIFEGATALGKVSVSHNPSFKWPGPHGVGITNSIGCTLEFPVPVVFREAIEAVLTLVAFFSIIAGRQQGLENTYVTLTPVTDSPVNARPTVLEVHWSYNPKGQRNGNDREPHPSEVLCDPVHHPESYATLLLRWLQRHEAMRDARGRFSSLFSNRRYDVERLIGLANVFDILPAECVPLHVAISPGMRSAVDIATTAFRNLPASPEKNNVLTALGRVGKSTLKQKIRHRARLVTNAVTRLFEDLELVTDEAVNCRNHYVHGSSARIDYSRNPDTMLFLTDTLEFVFATSDLVECGWDINEWLRRGSVGSHPFGLYTSGYNTNVKELRGLLRQ